MDVLSQIIKNNNFESIAILKALNKAHRYLGELKGVCQSMPNQQILINTLALQEAKDSSEIENIITTQDEIFKYQLHASNKNIAAKEVGQYSDAMNCVFQRLQTHNLITINTIVEAQKIIKGNDAGLRTQQGTTLFNEKSGEVVYTPPNPDELPELLKDLEQFINNIDIEPDLDPLIKMAIIHHQFESIHPFYDGNGRIGRIVNIVYLVQQGLLDTPILYLSRYINHNKSQYYQLLQTTRDEDKWSEWVLYMLCAVSKTAQSTIKLITKIKDLQQNYKHHIRSQCPKIYSQDLINNIFKHPYTKIAFLQEDLDVSRLTANRYLDQLVEENLLIKHKFGRENFYFNPQLIDLLSNTDELKSGFNLYD